MLLAACHCGAIRLAVSAKPDYLIDCNCSVCRRYGALWALYEPSTVEIMGHPENTVAYVWGKRSIRTMHCKTCGCVTHWESIESGGDAKCGINMRNFDLSETARLRVRRFDGADTWDYID